MKRYISIFALIATCTLAQSQTIQVNKENRTIAISAYNEQSAIADTGIISIGFYTYGQDENQVTVDAGRISNAIVKAMLDSGVKQDHIESTSQELTPVEKFDELKISKGAKYKFTQNWTVTVPAKDAANVLHLATNAGANNSGRIQWKLSTEDELEAQAAGKAIEHAHQIAEQIAKGLNVHLGPLVYASNLSASNNQSMPLIDRNFSDSAEFSAGLVMKQKASDPVSLSPQKIIRSATVYAVFAIE